jgi:hypothetical protein
MLRAAFLAILIACLPLSLGAQRGVVGSAQAGVGPTHSNFGAHSGTWRNSRRFVRGHEAGQARDQRNGYGWGAFPYFLPDYETGWPQEEETQGAASEAPLVRVRDESREREPARPLPAQVIEIPSTTTTTESKPLPATVFILTTGERFETQRYLLTASSVSLAVGREQKTIPLQMVDLGATIAANRDRGVNLRIPNDRNEVSVRF